MNEDETKLRDDGTRRKAHYGGGEQPWDTAVKLGWGPHFAAANVLKYLRRTKDPEHSLASARWYYEQLRRFNEAEVWMALNKQLTDEEYARLTRR